MCLYSPCFLPFFFFLSREGLKGSSNVSKKKNFNLLKRKTSICMTLSKRKYHRLYQRKNMSIYMWSQHLTKLKDAGFDNSLRLVHI
jgi:hypothetical protein